MWPCGLPMKQRLFPYGDHPTCSKPDRRSLAALVAQEPSTDSSERSGGEVLGLSSDVHRQPLRATQCEVELWPSQREAAVRSTDLTDDLVVALPTSAGKTRVAEIAALMTLSTGKRVLIVTPLRALSAQTEHSFRRTFGPLGFKVSSLYGASGVSEGDEDASARVPSSSRPRRNSTSRCGAMPTSSTTLV